MKTKKHTGELIAFISARLKKNGRTGDPHLDELIHHINRTGLRVSRRLIAGVKQNLTENSMNSLLDILAGEIKDRQIMMLVYDIIDSIAKQNIRSKTMHILRKRGKRRHLEHVFKTENHLRYDRVQDALEEEAHLRGLPSDNGLWPHQCHIWKGYFSHNTASSLQKLLSCTERDFSMLMYRFLADLAAAAGRQLTNARFDWEKFSYTGFSEEDLTSLFDSRESHLRVLDLPGNVDTAAIRKRYMELARQHHPDKGGDTATMASINLAYAALTRKNLSAF